jgi:glycolate oxidase
MESAAAAVSAVISARLLPAMLEFLDDTTIRCVEAYAHLGLPTGAGAMLLAESDGHPAVVAQELATIEGIFRTCGASQITRAATAADSDRLKVARRAAFTSLARMRPTTLMEDVAVPRSELANLVRRINDIGRKNGIMIGTFGHAGDGNLHPNYLTDEGDREEYARAHRTVIEVEEAAIDLGGSITGEHGVGLYKKALLGRMVGSASLSMMRKLKELMDPNLVLNPGKILDCSPRCEGRLPRSREEIRKFEDVAWV